MPSVQAILDLKGSQQVVVWSLNTQTGASTCVCTRLHNAGQSRQWEEKQGSLRARGKSLKAPHFCRNSEEFTLPGCDEGLFVSVEQNICHSLSACYPTYDIWFFICTLALGPTRVRGGPGEPT